MTDPSPHPVHNTPADQQSDPELVEHARQAAEENEMIAARDGYDQMLVDDLRKIAAEKSLPGRGKIRKKKDLIAALRNLDAMALEPDLDPEIEAQLADITAPPPEENRDDLHPDLQTMLAKQDERDALGSEPHKDLLARAQKMSAMEIRDVLKAQPALPQATRLKLDEIIQQRELAPLTGELYRVTADSKFAKAGIVYNMARGSIITPRTHDLEELRRQKVPFEPIKSVEMHTDRIGRQVQTVTL